MLLECVDYININNISSIRKFNTVIDNKTDSGYIVTMNNRDSYKINEKQFDKIKDVLGVL
jgi:hypothetical protein